MKKMKTKKEEEKKVTLTKSKSNQGIINILFPILKSAVERYLNNQKASVLDYTDVSLYEIKYTKQTEYILSTHFSDDENVEIVLDATIYLDDIFGHKKGDVVYNYKKYNFRTMIGYEADLDENGKIIKGRKNR